MAGGNRYKHRSLGGGLVPNNQQEPANRFYATPPEEPSLLEKALQLAQALGDSSSEYTAKANADPGNRLSPFGPVPTQFMKDTGQHLWDEKFGLVPAKKAWDSGTTLADILSGKEQSTPFASVQGTQLAGDTANNAAIAALDASTLIPGMGVVPKMGKGAGKAAASMADDVARAKPLGFDDWSPEWKAASDKGLDMSTEARMARAREQGFNVDEPLYRGQESDFLPSGGVYASIDPEMASLYARGQGGIGYPLVARGNMKPLPDTPVGSETMEGLGFDGGANARAQISGEGFDGASYADQRYILDPANVRSPSAAFDPDNIGKPSMLGMGFPFGGKDGEKPLLSALMDAFKGKPKESPLDQFTPPTSIDDIFTGGAPRGPREITGGAENPAGLEGGFMHDPRFNGPQQPVPYNPESGFGGLDARLGKGPSELGMGAKYTPADATRRSEPFFDARLTPTENKVAEMTRNGYTTPEIADELLVTDWTIRTMHTNIRQKGVEIPTIRNPSARDDILRLARKGLTGEQIAERIGKSVNNVNVQLHNLRKQGFLPPSTRSNATTGGVKASPPPTLAEVIAQSLKRPDDIPEADWATILSGVTKQNEDLASIMRGGGLADNVEWGGAVSASGEVPLSTQMDPYGVRVDANSLKDPVFISHSHPHIFQGASGEAAPMSLSFPDLSAVLQKETRGITSLEPKGGFGYAVGNPKAPQLERDEWQKVISPMNEAVSPKLPGLSFQARSAEGLPSSVMGTTEQEMAGQMALGEALRRTNMIEQFGYRPGHSAQTETLAKYQPAINAGADAAEKSLREVLKARGFTDGQIAMLIAQYGSLGAAMGALGYGAQQKGAPVSQSAF